MGLLVTITTLTANTPTEVIYCDSSLITCYTAGTITSVPFSFEVPSPISDQDFVVRIFDSESCIYDETILITPTSTSTPTPTPTQTSSQTPTNTLTPTITPTNSATPTISPTQTPTPTQTQPIQNVTSHRVGKTFDSDIYCACKEILSIKLYYNYNTEPSDIPIVGTILYEVNANGTLYNEVDGKNLFRSIEYTNGIYAVQISSNGKIIDFVICGEPFSPTPTATNTKTPTQTPKPTTTNTQTTTPTNTNTKTPTQTPKPTTTNTPTTQTSSFVAVESTSLSLSCIDWKDPTKRIEIYYKPVGVIIVGITTFFSDSNTLIPIPNGFYVSNGIETFFIGENGLVESIEPCPVSPETPTNTETVTQTPTQTETPTPTNTGTPTPTETPTNTETPTPTKTPDASPSQTPTETPTNTETTTNTETPTPTKTPDASPSQTQTITPTNTETPTPTKTPDSSPSQTQTITPTNTETPTPTKTPDSSPNQTQTITPTNTETPTVTPTETSTNTPTNTETPTQTPTTTSTITPTNTQTPTQTSGPIPLSCDFEITVDPPIPPIPPGSPTPTKTSTPTPTNTQTPTITSTITPTITPSTSQIIVPSDPTLEIYYQGSSASFFIPSPSSGSTFNQWVDSSSSSHNANPIGGGSGPAPEWWSNVQNGLGGVYFNGTSDGLSVNPLNDLNSKTGQTIIMVVKTLNSSSTAQYIQGGEDGNTGLNATYLRQSGSTYNIAVGGGFATGGVVNTNPHILSYVFSGTATNNSDRLKFYIDGSGQTLTFTTNMGTITDSTLGYVFLGVSYTSSVAGTTQFFYNGFLFDILIYSRALDPSELQAIQSSLSNKWNIPLLS